MLLLGAIMLSVLGLGHGFIFVSILPPDIAPPDMLPPDIAPPDIELEPILSPAMAAVFVQCFISPAFIAPPDIALSAKAVPPISIAAAAPIRIKRDISSSRK